VPYVPVPALTGREEEAYQYILSKWGLADKIAIRFGPRVSEESARQLVEIVNEFPQALLTSVFDSRGTLPPDVSPSYLDMSGPIGNAVANKAVVEADLARLISFASRRFALSSTFSTRSSFVSSTNRSAERSDPSRME
jgi:thiamine pyrophosphate-dependent acetolactate synthase large subunit-like protein